MSAHEPAAFESSTESYRHVQLPLFEDDVQFELAPQVLEGETGAGVEERFIVNPIQCLIVADHIGQIMSFVPVDKFAFKAAASEVQMNALIHLVGICDRLNWDFVMGELGPRLAEATNDFSLEGMEELSPLRFRRLFGAYSRDDGEIGFTRRLMDLQQISRHLIENETLHRIGIGASLGGPNGILELLRAVPVYSRDPLHKKVNALVHEMLRRRLISVIDPENVEPAIDYHILRLYLRTNRVVAISNDVKLRLIQRGRFRIEVTTELRRVVAEAMRQTAWMAGLSVSSLNEVEWAFGRQACRRDAVWCSSELHQCPLNQVCPSAKLGVEHIPAEPVSRHGFY
jgi:hypothetical protein